ncbi:MAG: T9SS type A sorting domain-containing protein [Bacteroidota bacterium]|nr:T9SS type A sorting domain-containing protein [Bacteroidota bacterium]
MKKLCAIIFVLLSFYGFTQRITNFRVFLAGTGVGIKFTITTGTSCNGYNIFHSTDSINFIPVYNFPGICGNSPDDENISFLHSTPNYNKTNYYKIELIPIEESPVLRIFVPEIPNKNSVIYPNPIQTNSDQISFRVFYSNSLKLNGFIYNQNGQPLRSLELTTIFDTATIGVSDLGNGFYILKLTDGEKTYFHKFIINR